jgi:putative transposase
MMRQEDPDYVPTVRGLGMPAARKFIAEQTSLLLGEKVYTAPPRGGDGVKGRLLYKGRTIYDYYQVYIDLPMNDRRAEAFVTLQHFRGNRTSRLPLQTLRMMTESWEKVGLDKKDPTVANVHAYLEVLIKETNDKRVINGLPKLVVPSQRTLRRHRDSLVTPTEYLIAVKGPREARNKNGRGSSDIRALMIGELCGMDEQKMSLVTSAKEEGFWHGLSDDEKSAYEAADKDIRKRLHLVIMFDVASRMPLAWIITENPNAEATLALLRMATGDKTREKLRYGCVNEPASGCGILLLRNDNGVGLRNSSVISSLMGIDTINMNTRTYSPTDRAPDERGLNTFEFRFFKSLPGYTGRRPGDLPGYDAIKNGVIDVEMLYGMLTRYLVDEYPFERHHGGGMFGRRPWDVYQQINETRGQVAVPDPHMRRIHLGWEVEVTPSDEGVRVFEGIWFNSDELQVVREEQFFKGKVKVFVDPDNLNIATVIMPGFRDPIEVILQTTAFADMTLGEVLQLVAEYRRDAYGSADIYEDRLLEARSRRYADISSIGVEHDLPRSYTTIEECKNFAAAVFKGARIVRTKALTGTIAPEAVTKLDLSEGVFSIGEAPSVVDGVAGEVTVETETDDISGPKKLVQDAQDMPSDNTHATKRRKLPDTKGQSIKFARPANLKELK